MTRLAFSCRGRVIITRYDILNVCKKLLSRFHNVKRESVIVLFLDEQSKCINVKVRFGSKHSIKFHTKDVCNQAPELKARKILVACNHVEELIVPTHTDIVHAATLYTNLPEGVQLIGYVVWCKHQAKSVLDSYDFKQMIRGI